MARKEIIPVEVQVNTSDANKNLNKTQDAIEGVNKSGNKIKSLASGFGNLAKTIGGNVVKAFTSLKLAAAAVNFGAIIELVKKLYENWESIQKVITNFIPGFGKFVNLVKGLLQNFTDFIGLTSQAERNAEALVKQTERQNEALDDQIRVLQAVGGQEAAIYKIQKEKNENELNSLRERLRLLGKLTEEEQKRFRELKVDQKVLEESEKKRIADAEIQSQNKAKADAKTRSDNAKAIRDAENQRITDQANRESEGQKILIDIYRASLSERERAILEAEDKAEQQRVALIKAGIYNFEAVEEEKRRAIAKVNEDFDKKEEKEKAEQLKEEQDKLKEFFEFLKEARDADQQNAFQIRLNAAETDEQIRLLEIERIENDYAKKIELAKQNKQDIVLLETLKNQEIDKVNKVAQKNQKDRRRQSFDSEVQMAAQALSIIGGLVDQNSAAGKGIAVAQAIINTYQGASKAIAQGGIFGPVAAAATIAAGLIQVKKIVSTKIPSATGGNVADKGISIGGPAPIAPTPSIQATLTQLDQSTVNRLGSASAKAYVVESDITSSQEKISRINRAARLS